MRRLRGGRRGWRAGDRASVQGFGCSMAWRRSRSVKAMTRGGIFGFFVDGGCRVVMDLGHGGTCGQV